MIKILLVIFTVLTLSAVSPVLAVALTPPSTPSANEVEENVADRIKNIVQQKVSTTEAMLKEKLGQMSLVGYVGRFKNLSSESITFQSNGDTIQVRTTDKTTINKNGTAKFSSLAIGDKAIVIGTMTLKDIIDAKRIVVVKDIPSELPKVTSGKIISANPKTRLVTIRTKDSDQELILSRKANLKIEQLVPGKAAILIYELQDKDSVITTAKVF